MRSLEENKRYTSMSGRISTNLICLIANQSKEGTYGLKYPSMNGFSPKGSYWIKNA